MEPALPSGDSHLAPAAQQAYPAIVGHSQPAPVTSQASASAGQGLHSAPAAQPVYATATGQGPPAAAALPANNARPAPQVTALRLPPFSADDPELWLAQVECAFGVAGISDDLARYQVLASSLPTNVAAQVRDVITCSAPTYAILTSALRQRLAHSRTSRLEALLRNQQLGDQRPSQLLRRMQGELTAAGDSPADSGLLRTLFLQRLPQGITATLSLLPENTALDELASSADRIMEASRPAIYPAAVSAIQPTPLLPAPAPAAPAADLLATVASLTATVSELQMEVRSLRQGRTHDRSSSCNRCRSQSRGRQRWSRHDSSPSRPRDDLCYYHRRFGAQAKKCQSPCSWMAQAGNETA